MSFIQRHSTFFAIYFHCLSHSPSSWQVKCNKLSLFPWERLFSWLFLRFIRLDICYHSFSCLIHFILWHIRWILLKSRPFWIITELNLPYYSFKAFFLQRKSNNLYNLPLSKAYIIYTLIFKKIFNFSTYI